MQSDILAHSVLNNNSLTGNIPDYSVVFPSIKKVSNKERRSSEDTEEYMIEGLSVPDMMVKLKHNTKLVSPGYGFNHLAMYIVTIYNIELHKCH